MKRKMCILLFKRKRSWPNLLLLQKKAKVAKPTPTSKEVVILSTIPRRVKTRAIKANPKIGDKKWSISFTDTKETTASSSLDSDSIEDTLSPPSQVSIFSTQTSPTSIPHSLRKIQETSATEGSFNRCLEVSINIY